MKDMDKAVDRVLQAIQNGEKLLVYGDYDVDGTTAVAVVYTYLKPFFKKKKIEFYIPDRYEEGYVVSTSLFATTIVPAMSSQKLWLCSMLSAPIVPILTMSFRAAV